MKFGHIKLFRFIIVSIITVILFLAGYFRIEMDANIINSLPSTDSVISDAVSIFLNHPIQDQLFIDVSLDKIDLDSLIEYGNIIEKKLSQSKLFKSVGIQDTFSLFPKLLTHILNNLPILFSEESLVKDLEPLLEVKSIRQRLAQIYKGFTDLSGIGQAEWISKDPLGFKDIILSKLSNLAPARNVQIYKGKIISPDSKHLLIIANPIGSGTDTKLSRSLAKLIDTISFDLNKDQKVHITPIGAYRAALDNESIVRDDVNNALVLSTIGSIILVLLCFSRPLIGIMSMVPALFGTMIAFFVFSLIYESIPLIVLGFGGVIISMTVDYGIAYLLFIDRPYETNGRQASREVFTPELLSAIASIGSFSALSFSKVPILVKLGQFTALGIFFSFLFVPLIFPLIFPKIPGIKPRTLFLQNILDKFAGTGKKGAYSALTFLTIMFFFAKPEFNIDISQMNTVTSQTLDAEKKFKDVWGNDLFSKIFFMIEGGNLDEIQKKSDRLLEAVNQKFTSGVIKSGFITSMIFPGKDGNKRNISAWEKFWQKDKINRLKTDMNNIGDELGFTTDAFEPFYNLITNTHEIDVNNLKIPEEFLGLMGINVNKNKCVQFSSFSTGSGYNSEQFYNEFKGYGKIFDPSLFSKRLSQFLFSTFIKISIIISLSIAAFLFFYFLDIKLTLVALLPVTFALISTLGTLKITGRNLDIPALMLSIMIFGTGIEYSVFFITSYQRYGKADHPSFGVIRITIFMASGTTLISLGVLSMSNHMLLKSVGLTSLLGIGYSLIGSFLIVPYFMELIYKNQKFAKSNVIDHRKNVLKRYNNMETYTRFFVRFKTSYDSMFYELPQILHDCPKVNTIIDIGTGYGIPACWLLEIFPDSKIFGIEPDIERVRIASMAIGDKGHVEYGHAPDIPECTDLADIAIMLDIIHYLNDEDFLITLKRLNQSIRKDGILIIRAGILPKRRSLWIWWLENIKFKIQKATPHYRTLDAIKEHIKKAGFIVESTSPSQSKEDFVWIVSKS